MSPKEISLGEFEDLIKEEEGLILLDLWADWCHPCKMIEPFLAEIEEKYGERVKVLRLNVDLNPEAPIKFGVASIPTVIFFKGGKERGRIVGAMPKKEYEKKVEENL